MCNHSGPCNKLEHRNLWELGCSACLYSPRIWFNKHVFSFTPVLGHLTNLVTGKFRYCRTFLEGAGSLSIWTISLGGKTTIKRCPEELMWACCGSFLKNVSQSTPRTVWRTEKGWKCSSSASSSYRVQGKCPLCGHEG